MGKQRIYKDPRWGFWGVFLHNGQRVGPLAWAVSEIQARQELARKGFPFSPDLMTISRVEESSQFKEPPKQSPTPRSLESLKERRREAMAQEPTLFSDLTGP